MASIEVKNIAFSIPHIAIVGPVVQDNLSQNYVFAVTCVGCAPVSLTFSLEKTANEARELILDRVENG